MPSPTVNRNVQPASNAGRRWFCRAALGLLAVHALPSPAPARPVKSALEARHDKVVTQQFDLSCGAATLTTILNFQHGERLTEREVAIRLIGRTEYLENPNLLRAKNGFSLLDLKRVVEEYGYKGTGLGQMDFEQLAARAPAIIPTDIIGYPHYVVYRGFYGDRVLVADPAYGNRSFTRKRFMNIWFDYPDYGRLAFIVDRTDGLIPPNRLGVTPADFVTLS